MPWLFWALILWLHLLAAITWIGGLVFQVLVVFPTLARAAPSAERLRFALSLEARFRVLVWPAVGLVLFTGLVNLMHVWYATVVTAVSVSPTFLPVLSIKLSLVVGMIVLQAVLQVVVQPTRFAAPLSWPAAAPSMASPRLTRPPPAPALCAASVGL